MSLADTRCHTCRHHSKSERPAQVIVADADMEMIEESDEKVAVYNCMHKKQSGKEIGIGDSAGANCSLWEESRMKSAAELDELMARANNRTPREDR